MLKKVGYSTFFILITILFISSASAQETANPSFSQLSYQSSIAKSVAQSYKLDDLSINITESYIEQKDSKDDTANDAALRAKITVEKGGRIIDKLIFNHMQGCVAGLFLPKPQPISNYFIIMKHGDYDGQLLLIGKDGKIIDIGGGSYFITADKQYIFSNYEEDTMGTGFAVFDLLHNKVVYQTSKKDNACFANIDQWYEDAKGYFFVATDKNEENQAKTKNNLIFAYELTSNKLLRQPAGNRLKEAKKVQLQSLDKKEFAVLAL